MHGNLPTDRSNSLGDLAARIAAEHEQVGLAAKNILKHAMAAGDMLAEAKAHIKHGGWAHWLKKCDLSPRTASHYMRLAENREAIEAKSATVADLTVRAALRSLKPKKPKADTEPKPAKKPVAPDLSSLAWSDALAPKRTSFVDAVGLQALYAAAPPDHQQKFRAWLRQQEASAVEQPQAAPLIPADLSIPDILRRQPEAAS